ncbi:MAG: hypothetical protein WDO70_11355 [Alphaproteobacteria bacterium]
MTGIPKQADEETGHESTGWFRDDAAIMVVRPLRLSPELARESVEDAHTILRRIKSGQKLEL